MLIIHFIGLNLSSIEDIQYCIDEMIKPAIQEHSGDIELVSLIDGIVTIKLSGMCHSCPSKQVTLHQGIGRYLTEEFPGMVLGVELADNNEEAVDAIVATAKEMGLYDNEETEV